MFKTCTGFADAQHQTTNMETSKSFKSPQDTVVCLKLFKMFEEDIDVEVNGMKW